MNVAISGDAERIIRSQLQSGRYASEGEVIDDAPRRLDAGPVPDAEGDPSMIADQELQRR